MHIRILNIAQKVPLWVNTAFQEYQKRLQPFWPVELITLPLAPRPTPTQDNTKNVATCIEQEGVKLSEMIRPRSVVVALDLRGKTLSTEQFSQSLQQWSVEYPAVDFLIGGPDGLAQRCKQRAHLLLSLSALTFAHPLVRIILIEQLYRAWSILNHHPYHR
jgi:23S rRNA (pseudouridine1915-N3)-methyltransferase